MQQFLLEAEADSDRDFRGIFFIVVHDWLPYLTAGGEKNSSDLVLLKH